MNDQTKFFLNVIAALVMFGSYFAYGILQEIVVNRRFGDCENESGINGDRLPWTSILVIVQSSFTAFFAYGKFGHGVASRCKYPMS